MNKIDQSKAKTGREHQYIVHQCTITEQKKTKAHNSLYVTSFFSMAREPPQTVRPGGA